MLDAVLAPVPITLPADINQTVPAELPEGARRMLSAAVSLEDLAQLEAVVNAAKLAFPDDHAAIDALLVELTKPTEPLRVEALVVTGTQPESQKWSFLENVAGSLDLNAARTDGNTETSNFGARLNASMKRQANIHRVEAYANTGEANGIRNQENWGTSYQLDTLWTDDVFGYLRASYEGDEFLGFEYRAFAGAGAGYYFLQAENRSVRGEVGPGYRYSRFTETGEEDADWVLYGAMDTHWNLTQDWRLAHNSKVTLSEPSTSVSSRSQISTTLTEAIRAGMTYELAYEENPPNNNDNFDTIWKFNVSYGF
ncbi:MAG: DUF481 domain-containing protein [Pseudomonadota bacterium]